MISCPPDDVLSAIIIGDTHVAGPWLSHVEGCSFCRDRLEGVLNTVTASWAGINLASSKTPSSRPAVTEVLDDVRTEVDRIGEAREEVARRLRPPEQPDELGRLGPYRVLDVLGAGGMGIVLRAEEPALGRLVALKVMRAHLAASPDAIARFHREARAMAAVEHENVVPIYRVDADNGVPYVAMPLLAGESLAALVRRVGRLAPTRVIALARQIVAGLAAAHDRGLMHRDIKPANIWLEARPDGSERVRLLDFGLARSTQSDVSGSGTIIGTPAYMSPEQARGQPADHRTDLFSLGVVLYRLSTGLQPFTGEDNFAIARKIVEEEPTPSERIVPNLPRALSDVIRHMMHKEPAKRPASARAVAEALSHPDEPSNQSKIDRSRFRGLVWAIPLMVLLLIGLAALLGGPWQRSPAPKNVPEEKPIPVEVESSGTPRLLGTVGPEQKHLRVYAMTLLHRDGNTVLLSEAFPGGKSGSGVHVWSAELQLLGLLESKGAHIRALTATPDGTRFVTVGGGGLEVWSLEGLRAKRIVPPASPPAAIGGIAIDPTGQRVYTIDFEDESKVRTHLLTATALTPAAILPEVLGRPWQLEMSADGRWLAATSKAGKVCLWNLKADSAPVGHVLRPDGPPFPVVAFARDSRRAWIIEGTSRGGCFDLADGTPKRLGDLPTELGAGPAVSAFTDATGGRLIVVAEFALQVFDITAASPRLVESREILSPIRCAAHDVKAGHLYTGHDDGIRKWDVSNP